jgi:hypothetical protein
MASKNKQNSRCGLTLGNKEKTGTLYPSFGEKKITQARIG